MKKLKTIFAILMFVTGIGIAAYPIVSNILYERNATQVVESYNDTVEEMDQEEIDAAKEAARKYNEQLFGRRSSRMRTERDSRLGRAMWI